MERCWEDEQGEGKRRGLVRLQGMQGSPEGQDRPEDGLNGIGA